MNRQAKRRRAFTLIELLVVIAIIATLAALLFPAIRAMLTQAKRNKTRTQIHTLLSSIKLFKNTYGRWPGQHKQGRDGDIRREDIAHELTNNVRRIQFIDLEPGMLSDERHTFIDPWGRDFVIVMDENTDGKIEIHATEPETGAVMSTTVVHETIAIFSWGQDPKKERKRILSWNM